MRWGQTRQAFLPPSSLGPDPHLPRFSLHERKAPHPTSPLGTVAGDPDPTQPVSLPVVSPMPETHRGHSSQRGLSSQSSLGQPQGGRKAPRT